MKKIAVALIMLICCCFGGKAQEKKIRPIKHFISIGYGYKLDTKWWRTELQKMNFDPPKTTNDVYVTYEYSLKKKISVGLDLAFIDVNKDDFGLFEPMSVTYAYTAKALRILPSFNYHLLDNSKLDVYINIEAGFYFMTTEHIYYSYDPNPLNSLGFLPVPLVRNVIRRSKTEGADFSAGIGLGYHFTKNLAVFCETGSNKSIFQAGLMLSL